MSAPLYGVAAEFTAPASFSRAVAAATAAGFTKLDAFAPFPMPGVAQTLGVRPSALPRLAWAAGAVGATVQFGAQWWMNGIDYPLNVGGRPLLSWPAFLPSTLIVAILWAGAAALIGLLLSLRLPQLHHPLFAMPGFNRASEDRFFLAILREDPRFDTARSFLEGLRAEAVRDIPA